MAAERAILCTDIFRAPDSTVGDAAKMYADIFHCRCAEANSAERELLDCARPRALFAGMLISLAKDRLDRYMAWYDRYVKASTPPNAGR
jgi:hypothetical protein